MAGPGFRLRVRVAPGSSASGIVGRHGEGWKVRVDAPPERGRANEAVLAVLAEALGVRRDDVRLLHGATGKDKLVEVMGITAAEAKLRLAAAGGAA